MSKIPLFLTPPLCTMSILTTFKMRGFQDKMCGFQDNVCRFQDKMYGFQDNMFGLLDILPPYRCQTLDPPTFGKFISEIINIFDVRLGSERLRHHLPSTETRSKALA